VKLPRIQVFGIGIGLFLAVYIPAFVTTALVRPRIEIAIPLIIAITLLVALLLILLLARSPAGIAEFGFHIPHSRYVVSATLFGLTIGLAVTFLSHSTPVQSPV
jgi:protein-S-isoprenylcysteine O-methyltransferase Ste14